MDFDIYQNSLDFGYFGLAAAESVVLLGIVLTIVGLGLFGARLVARRRA